MFQGDARLTKDPTRSVEVGAVVFEVFNFLSGLFIAIDLNEEKEAVVGYEDVTGIKVTCAVEILEGGLVLANGTVEDGASIKERDIGGGVDAPGVKLESVVVVFLGFLEETGENPCRRRTCALQIDFSEMLTSFGSIANGVCTNGAVDVGEHFGGG